MNSVNTGVKLVNVYSNSSHIITRSTFFEIPSLRAQRTKILTSIKTFSINKLMSFSVDTSVDTWSRLHGHLGQESTNYRRYDIKCQLMHMWVCQHSDDCQPTVDQILIKAQPSVAKVLIEMWIKCQSRHRQLSIMMWILRVSIHTQLRMS